MSRPRRPPRGGGRQPAKSFYDNPFKPIVKQYKATHPAAVKAVRPPPVTQRQKDEAAVFAGKMSLLPTEVAAATPSLFGAKKGEVKRIATHALAQALPTGPLKPTISAPPTQSAKDLHQQAVWARNVVVPGKTGQKARKHLAASLTPAERKAKLAQQETSYAATKAAIDARTFHAPRSDFGVGANTDKLAAAAHAVVGITKAVLPTVHRDPFTHQPVLGAPSAAVGVGHILGDVTHGAVEEAPAVGNFILHQQPLKGVIDNARAAAAVARGDVGAPIANVVDAARSGIHSLTGLGRAATEIGRGNVSGGTRLGLSSAAGAAQAGGLAPVGLGQAANLPGDVVGGLVKVGLGTVASVPGMAAHPIRSLDEAVGFIRGGGDAAIALAFLAQPGISSHDRNHVYGQLWHGFWDDLMNKYGPDVTLQQAIKNGYNQPLIHVLDGLGAAAIGAKGASIMRYFKIPGVGLRDAARLSRDPTLLGEIAPGAEAPRPPRTATIRGANIDPYQVPLHESQSPLWRGITRNVGDPLARGAEKVAGPRFPLSETKKGLRAQRQLSKQQVRRYAAQAHALMNQVSSYLGKEPEQGVRLFLSHQRPADIPEEVWLKALLKNTQDMLEEGPAQAARKLTPREQQLMRQVKAMRAGVDRLSQERWGRRVEDVYHEQERLHHSLLLNEHHLKGARERLRAVEGPDEAGVYTDSIYKLRTDRLALEQQLQKLVESPSGRIDDIQSKLDQIKAIDEHPFTPSMMHATKDSMYIDLVQNAAREIQWSKFPDKRSAVLDFWTRALEREQARSGGAAPDAAEIALIRGALHRTSERISALESGRAHSLEMGDIAKGSRIQGARDDVRTLENTRGVLQEQLDAMTVDQAPVESAMRTDLIGRMNELPGVSEVEAAHLTNLFDTSARRWGDHFNRDPGEFYSDPTGFGLKEIRMIQEHADAQLPEGALAQTRELPGTPFKPTDQMALTNRNRAVHVRAVRRGEPTWRKKNPDGSYTEARTNADTHGLKYANEPAVDAQGRPLFGQEVPFDVLKQRWEEGFDRTYRKQHPGASDAEVLAARPEAMLKSALFYEELFPLFGRIMHDREILSWLASQKGASPARGLLDLQKTIERAMTRERIGPRDIGLASQTMAKILYGEKDIPEGVAAKLTDFTDVGTGNTGTRTWTGHDPATGAPYVADRWEARGGPGLVDDSYLSTLYREHDAALQAQGYISREEWTGIRNRANKETRDWADARTKAGKKPTDNEITKQRTSLVNRYEGEWEKANPDRKLVKTDMKQGLSKIQYEHVSDYGNQLAEHLNSGEGYLGKQDWNTGTSQALNWAGVQHSVGEIPENIDTALYAQERGVAFEVEGVGRLAERFPQLQHLPPEQRFAVTRYVADRAIDLAAQKSGAIVVRASVGHGGWEGAISPSVRVGVLASGHVFTAFVDNLRDLLDEAEVWGFHSHSRAAFRQLSVKHAVLNDPQVLLDSWNELRAAHPEFMGFTQEPGGGFASMLSHPDGSPFEVTQEFQTAVDATLRGIEQKHGVKFDSSVQAVDPVISSRTRSAVHAQLERNLGQARSDAERRRHRASARSAEKSLRVGQPERDAVERQIQRALDTLDQQGPEALDREARLAGRIEDPSAQPATERVAATARVPSRVLDPAKPGERTLYPPAPKGTTPPELLAQTRGQDLYGAVHFLDTPEGQRILYLTQQADVSTLLHELYGHNVREIAAAYPEQWARVETFVGKPLAEWDETDHEQFARWSERYFADGVAPTPELVPVFQHLKRSYRETYGAMNHIGKPPPPEVKALFDEMFGSYDDPNVFRVANMTTSIPHDMRSAEQHAIFEFTSQQLASLRRRNDTRAYNRSIEKLQKDYEKQGEKADAAGGFDQLSEDDQTQMIATRSQLLTMQAEKTMADVDRATGLRRRVDQIEAALANPTGPGYDGALAALGHLTDMRETILKSVFGDKYDSVFSNRVDLLADHLVDKGLIEPDFARGTAKYAPHMPLGGKEPRRVDRPAQGLEGGVIGEVDQSLLGLHNKNNLYRWQNGDLSTDPKVIFDVWQNAQAFAFIKEMKDLVWDMGRPLGRDEPIPDNVFLVKKNGTPVPHVQKVASGVASTDEVQDALTALEARDPAKLEEVVTRYVDDTFLKSEDVRAEIQAAGAESADAALAARMKLDNVRVVDRHIVEGLFRPLRGGTSFGSRTVDWANTVARWSLIYTNPAYIPVNFIGNNFYLLAQQGPLAVVNLMRASKMLLNDKELAIRVAGEGGELPARAAIARGRGIGEKLRHKEERYLNIITTIPDKMPRMAAWVYEARRMGYRTKEDMLRLIDAPEGSALARRRDLVSHRTTEIMVNFDRMSDWERQTVTKVLFIWPWIRGATAWPFYYAKEFPVQTALAANLGQVSEDRRKAMMGNVRSAYRDLFPVSKHGQFARTINVSALSPTSTAADSIQALLDLGRINVPSEQGSRVMDFFNPLWQGITQNVTGMNDYGQPISHKDALFDSAVNFVPFGGLIRQVIDPSKASKVYNRRDWKALVERRVGKVLPMEVDLNRLHAFQTQTGKKTTQQRLDDKMASLVKSRDKVGGTMPIPRSVRHALLIQTMYEEEVARQEHDLGQSTDWHPKSPGAQPTLSPLQQAQIVYQLYIKTFPVAEGVLPRPEQIQKSALGVYHDGLLYGNEKEGFPRQDALLGPLQEYRSDLSKEKTGGR